MPIPIVIAALAAGGTLVAHGAGGFIVTSSAGAYVAGTYISTTTVVALLSGSAGLIAGGVTAADARIAGRREEVSRSPGTISSAPAWVSNAAAGIRSAGRDSMGFATGQVYRMRAMAAAASEGVEVRFTDSQARVLQFILLQMPRSR